MGEWKALADVSLRQYPQEGESHSHFLVFSAGTLFRIDHSPLAYFIIFDALNLLLL
jgi:hypothetical protein